MELGIWYSQGLNLQQSALNNNQTFNLGIAIVVAGFGSGLPLRRRVTKIAEVLFRDEIG